MRRSWLIYAVVYLFFLSTLAMAEVRKLTQEDIEWGDPATTVTSEGGHVGHRLSYSAKTPPYMDVRDYGTALTDAPITAAIAAAENGATIVIPDNTYVFASQVTVNKAVTIILMGTQITGPAAGWAFDVTVNDAGILARGDAKITLTQGCDGGIRNNQALRTKYHDFKIDMNDVTNATGFYQYGGWYVDVENVEIEKVKTAASSDGVKIVGTYTGVAGSTGSWGGSYVSTYKNVVARTVRISAAFSGANLNKVTTMTFTNLDAETVYATNALSLTFKQPVMQITSGGTFWSLDNVAGFTAVGGDFEGSGTTIYTLSETVRGISSLGNQMSGASNVYISGDVSENGVFFDDDASGQKPTGFFRGYISSIGVIKYRNTAYVESARVGHNYGGDQFTISNNGIKTADNTATLDNTGIGASFLSVDTSGRVRIQLAYPGSNPVAVDNVAQFDSGGVILTLPYTYDNNATAAAAGLTVGRFYKTSTGQLMIVY